MYQSHILNPSQVIRLNEFPTEIDKSSLNREAVENEFRANRDELIELQRRLYAQGDHSLLVIFQAMDAGGKDGTIRKVFRGVNPQGVHVASFKVPSKDELAHDFLWRVHKQIPAKGMIGVFNRSHYEDVLVVRVDNIFPESVWRPRYQQIRNFEKLLVESGTTILKFFLHISKREQKERFQARIDDPSKNWKFSFEDLDKRNQWDNYMGAYEEMLRQTNTEWAPWYLVPADQKWYRNFAISKILVGTLEKLNPQYPPPEEDLSNVIVV